MAVRGEAMPSLPVVAGWYDELHAVAMARVSFTGEQMIMSDC